jgi:hypothetical protein
MDQVNDIHLPALEPLLCVLCAVRLEDAATTVRIYCAAREGDAVDLQAFNHRGTGAIAGLAWLVAQLYENRRWVRVEFNDRCVGIYGVTTVWGTAVCAHHIGAAVQYTPPNGPIRKVLR